MAEANGGPAFPRTGSKDIHGYGVDEQGGMSLRDYFAGQSIMGNCPGVAWPDGDVAMLAEWAYRMADAMLAARKASA